MASSQKTPFLGLNQWLGTDRPKRDDFNRDNLNTETKVRAHCDDVTAHVTAQERTAWNKGVYEVGTYTGNGVSPTRTINLGYQPRLLLLFAVGHAPIEYRASYDSVSVFSATYTPQGASLGIEAAPMGFTVRNSTNPVASGNTMALNQQGTTYVYITYR